MITVSYVWLERLSGAALLCVALVLAVAAFLGASLLTAWIVDSPAVFIALGLLVACGVTYFMSLLALRVAGLNKRRPVAMIIACTTPLLLFIGCRIFLLEPLVPKEQQFSIRIPDDVELWSLNTGSQIAVRKVIAQKTRHPYPIVFVHGGPGAYSVSMKLTVEPLSRLSADGHDVYFYDQVGGGLSARLEDISHYTLKRHLDDLGEILQRIDAQKVILIASSGGATLAANFMATHPDQVAAAVFSGPGALFHPDWANGSDGGLDERMTPAQRRVFSQRVETPRLFAALALAEVNPRAAVNFASEAELGSLFDQVANEFYLPLAVCRHGSVDARSSGYGFWSNRMTGKTLHTWTHDPRPALSRNSTPLLVVRGACDYKQEAVAREYASVFPNARFTQFDNAGHMVFWEQPEEYLVRVRQFLGEVGLSIEQQMTE